MTGDGVLGLCDCPHHANPDATCELGACCEPCPTCGADIAHGSMRAHQQTHHATEDPISVLERDIRGCAVPAEHPPNLPLAGPEEHGDW